MTGPLRNALLGAALTAAVVGGALFILGRAPPPVDLAFSLPAGRYVEHDIAIREDTTVVPFAAGANGGAPPAMHALTQVDVRLRLLGLGGGRVRAQFVDVRAASTQVDGREVIDAQQLQGPVAELEVAPDARVQSVRLPQLLDPTFGRVLRMVLNEAAFPLGSGTSWQATEKLARGTLVAQVTVKGAPSSGAVELARVRTMQASTAPRADVAQHPPALAGSSVARVRTDGVLLALAVDEDLSVYDAQGAQVEHRGLHVTSSLAAEGAFTDAAPAAVALLPAVPADAPVANEETGRRALEQRTDGLTRAALNAVMIDAIVAGRAPDHEKFLWRATARLKLDDGAVDDVAAQFVRAEASSAGRQLALDLLAAASSAHAQQALVSLLQLPVVEQDAEVLRMRQRLALVPAPSPATMAFLTEQSRAPQASWRDPARIALGAAARHRRAFGDVAAADAARAVLEDESAAAVDAEQAQVLLLALGNTWDPAAAPAIVAHAGDPLAQTRHVVAEALREIDAPQARTALLTLATDKSAAVSRRALESLARHKALDAGNLTALRDAVSTGGVPDEALGNVATAVAARRSDAEARAVLEAVLARRPDPRLSARVRGLLASP